MTISVLIIFSAFVICLFLSALILTKKKKTRSDKYLLAYLLFNALLFLGCFVYFQYLIDTPQILVMFGGIFQLPFLFLYSCSVFGKTISLKIKRLIFIPASYTIVIIIFLLLIMTESELTLTFDSSIYNAPF
ncbi:MAG: hypothetical protein PQJ46_13490, partial [Spirochaetales bacterium]|nr:hypothetical protein [Spirochaetales bacterium]